MTVFPTSSNKDKSTAFLTNKWSLWIQFQHSTPSISSFLFSHLAKDTLWNVCKDSRSLQSRSREQGVKKWISFLITVFPSTIPSNSPQFVYKAKCRFCRGEGYGTTLAGISHIPSLCLRLLAVSYYSCSGIWLFSPPSYMLEYPFPLKLHISIWLALSNKC